MKPSIVLLALFSMFMALPLIGQLPASEIAISASSTLPAGKTSDYNPDNLVDGTGASWSEGADGWDR